MGGMLRGLGVVLELAVLISSASAVEPALAPREADEKVAPRQTDPRRVTVNKPVIADSETQATPRNTDEIVAACLAIENQTEVRMAELALSNAKQDRVRDFAEKMVKDHGDMLAKLEQFTSAAGRNSAAATGGSVRVEAQANAPKNRAGGANSETVPPRSATVQVQGGNRGFDFLAIKREIADQCLSSARKCWEEKGSKAEMGYVGQQIVAHQHMIDSGKVLREHVTSSELKQLIDDGVATAEEHKKHAEELIDELAQEEKSQK